MSTIKNILIPTDFSETAARAVAHGAHMADLFNAKIFLFHSIESFVHLGAPGEPALVQESEDMWSLAENSLKEAADEIKQKYEVEISTIVMNGKPVTAITEAVRKNAIDIIVMGTHGASGFEEFFAGSNAQKVVDLAPCPIISVRATTKNVGFSNIVMPIISEFYSRQKVNNVIQIATKYNSTVHIIGLLETNDPVDDKKFEIKLETVEEAFLKVNIKYTKKLVRGSSPAMEALKFCDEVGGDLIVIMANHESDIEGLFLGAFAKHVVNHSKIPVMSVHPVETTIEDFDPSGGTGML